MIAIEKYTTDAHFSVTFAPSKSFVQIQSDWFRDLRVSLHFCPTTNEFTMHRLIPSGQYNCLWSESFHKFAIEMCYFSASDIPRILFYCRIHS